MITKEQRETLIALIESYAEASAEYAASMGDGSLATLADLSAQEVAEFLDLITDA